MGVDRAKLTQAIDGMRDELVDITSDLIRFRTFLQTGEHFKECTEYMAAKLEEADLRADVVKIPDEQVRAMEDPHSTYRVLVGHYGPIAPRYVTVARRRGAGQGKRLHLNGHYCVLPPYTSWSTDMFAPRVHNGKVIGRGACDMKGGLAMIAGALLALKRLSVPLAGDVNVSVTMDTHAGGELGAGHVTKHDMGRSDIVIIGDMSGVNRVLTGYKGDLLAQIETHGAVAHASTAFYGRSAVEDMGHVMRHLMRLKESLEKYQSRANVKPDRSRQSILAITNIEGGTTINNTAASCTLGIDWRIIPEETPDDALGRLQQAVDDAKKEIPGLQATVRRIYGIPGSVTPETAPVVQTLLGNIKSVTGRPGETFVHNVWFDHRWFTTRWGADAAVYGPGDCSVGTEFRKKVHHEPDEYVVIDDLVNATKVLALSIVDCVGAA